MKPVTLEGGILVRPYGAAERRGGVHRERPDSVGGCQGVDEHEVGSADAESLGVALATAFVDVEDDPLTLPEHSEDAALQAAGLEVDLGSVLVEDDHPEAGLRVVDLDDALHRGGSIGSGTGAPENGHWGER